MIMAALAMSGAMFGCACFCFPPKASAGNETSPLDHPISQEEAEYFAARLELRDGQKEKALARLDKLRAAKDCPPHVYIAIAEIQRDQLELEKMRATLDEGTQRFPDNVELLILQAKFLSRTGKMDEAIAKLNKALKIESNRQQVLEELSDLYLQRLRSVSSEQELDKQITELIGVYERMLQRR